METNTIINKYYGGLGNQMFQYTFGLNLEKRGKTVIADTSWYENINNVPRKFCLEDVFDISLHRDEDVVQMFNKRYANRMIGTKVLNRLVSSTRMVHLETKAFLYDERALKTNKRAVSGYWQCYKYVQNVSEKVRKDFTFINKLPLELGAVLKKVDSCNSVFIHLRGDDYISDFDTRKLFGGICTKDYYKKAISLMKNYIENPVFYVFTNDKNYAQSILEENEVSYISDDMERSYEDWIDLMLMSKFKHAIIANSTFSWWGAWLMKNKQKIVIAPERWINNCPDADICEPGWTKI